MKQKKNLLIVILAFFVWSCQMSAARPKTTPEPFYIDGTPYTDPMELIAQFAKQTAIAQTETADPYYSSPVYATQMPDTTAILFVDLPDGRRESFSQTELASLSQTTVTAGGSEFTGVSLLAVLEEALQGSGDSIQTVSVSGLGSLTLLKSKVGDDFILLVTGGSLRLVSPSLPNNAWIDEVTLITLH
ncbi:MAG TPA: hypothetical protein PLI15_04135 [Anaerolineales bacterium]|nr:hypothetical protein [Anaerolineales bacterium]HMX18460.1 hypothetical protein [Anaerolineales bacterium]HMZ42215.1 hypothetical protein [Anaerolineales bacterium]HNA53664.1 hypothetical protein [Anaerolineales bacterium]HND90976.1 hypothetical protein [Anaerolineales bacterium]